MSPQKGSKMNRVFIRSPKTQARNNAIAWAVMAAAMGVFFVLGWRVLMTGDAFNVFVGIGMISIGSVGLPWSIVACIINALDARG